MPSGITDQEGKDLRDVTNQEGEDMLDADDESADTSDRPDSEKLNAAIPRDTAGSRQPLLDQLRTVFNPWLALSAALTSFIVLQLRLGYQFGFGDQAVLSIKGISSTDNTAWINDWFNSNASQPHWAFDLLTYLGERVGALPLAYFLYYLAALVIFGIASAVLAQHWLTGRAQWLALLIGPIVVLGPQSPLGSTTPLLPNAIPHVLGGCLAYLVLALLIVKRPLAASIVAGAVAIAHVQHGANIAVILLIFAVIQSGLSKRDRWTLVAAGMFAGLHAVLATRIRGITGNGDDFLEICALRSPHHCDANTWSAFRMTSGWFLALLIVTLILLLRKTDLRAMVVTTGVPLFGLLVGVWSDRLDVPIFGELAQSTNIYRLVTLLVPFAAWAAVIVITRSTSEHERSMALPFGTALLIMWFGSYSAPADLSQHQYGAMFLAVFTVAIIAVTAWSYRVKVWMIWLLVAAIVVATVLSWSGLHLRSVQVFPDQNDPRVATGQLIEQATPPGSIIAASPSLTWLRYASRRAVVADCKAVPYGGTPWVEYKERIEALGGWVCSTSKNVLINLTLEDIQGLQDNFGATHVFVLEGDPKFESAREAGWNLVGEYNTWIGDPAFPLVNEPTMYRMRLFEIG